VIDLKWQKRFYTLAEHIAQWSKDPSTKVGAVIADARRRVVSVGYNGFPRHVRDSPERYEDRQTKYSLVVHAEANAILNAPRPVNECALFITFSPCSACAKMIVQSGIIQVYAPPPILPEDGRPWSEDAAFAKLILAEAGIEIDRPF